MFKHFNDIYKCFLYKWNTMTDAKNHVITHTHMACVFWPRSPWQFAVALHVIMICVWQADRQTELSICYCHGISCCTAFSLCMTDGQSSVFVTVMLLVLQVPVGLSSRVWCQNTEYFHWENSKDSLPVYSVSSVLLHVFVWRKSQAVVRVRSWEEISVFSILCVKVVCVFMFPFMYLNSVWYGCLEKCE